MGCTTIEEMPDNMYFLYNKIDKQIELDTIYNIVEIDENNENKNNDEIDEEDEKKKNVEVYLIKTNSITNLINLIEETEILMNEKNNIKRFNKKINDSYYYSSDKGIEFICDYNKAVSLSNDKNKNENKFIIVKYDLLTFLKFHWLDETIIKKKVELSFWNVATVNDGRRDFWVCKNYEMSDEAKALEDNFLKFMASREQGKV